MVKCTGFKAIFIFTCFLLVLSTCNNQPKSNSSKNGKDNFAKAIPVQTHIVQTGTVVEKVQATGTVFPWHDVLILSETTGRVSEILVEVGDQVHNGDTLVVIDDELKQLALQQAKARWIEARAAYEKAQKDFKRNKKLFENQNISEYVFENARLQKESAYAAYLTAQAALKTAEKQLRDTRITAPVDGLIASRQVDLGTNVAPGTPILRLVNLSKVKIKLGVPEKDVVKIKKGLPAIVTSEVLPDTFRGKIYAVGPQADLSSRAFPVEVLLDNPEFVLKGGMVVKVEILTRELKDQPLLPKSALLERSGQLLVFVVKDNIAHERKPKLGLESGEFITVLEGIQAGERVVVLGQENLVDGARVVVEN